MAPTALRALVSALGASAASAAATCAGGACAADDGLSALQVVGAHVAGGNATARRSRSGNDRSVPFLGGRNGVLEDHEAGEILINEDGVWNKYYLPGANIQDGGKTVMYKPPFRFYLMKKPTTDYSNAENFYKPVLPGKTFTVDMKLENVGCGCNVNFYLVDMPVKDAGKDRDHYCDAQCFDGLGCCAEFDMNEGNNVAQQVTNHACSKDYPDHPDWNCHKWGEPEVKVSPGEFASGRGVSIDGNKPFEFSQEFRMTDGQLQVITTITQGEKKVVKTMGPNAQLQHMLTEGSLMKGMAFVTGYWTAPDMNWLDGDSCGSGYESCSEAPAFISNWRITTNAPAKVEG